MKSVDGREVIFTFGGPVDVVIGRRGLNEESG